MSDDSDKTIVIFKGKKYEDDRSIKEILLSLVKQYKEKGRL